MKRRRPARAQRSLDRLLPDPWAWALALALLAIAAPSCGRIAHAQDPGPSKLEVLGDVVQVVRSLPVKIRAPEGADLYLWRHASSVESSEEGATLEISKAPLGAVRVTVQILRIDWEGKRFRKETLAVDLLIGSTPPPPPGPGPDPPPPPPPAAVPFPAADPQVLILEETSERNTLPSSQIEILGSLELRRWASAHLGKRGGSPALRIWDDDPALDPETAKDWGEALKAAKRDAKSFPWIVASDGKRGFSQALPKTLAETLDLLRIFEEKTR